MLAAYLHHLLPVWLAYVIVVASPGPSNMAIMGTAMERGRAAGLALALGVVTGSMIWAMMAASGLSAMLAVWANALLAIKIAGGLYLLYLAIKAARSAIRPAAQFAALRPATRAALYRRGVLMHLTNPKAILGWIAIMSLALRPGAVESGAPAHILPPLIAGCAVLGIVINLGYALVFSTPVMARAYQRARRGIDGLLAAVFGYAGLRLLLSRA